MVKRLNESPWWTHGEGVERIINSSKRFPFKRTAGRHTRVLNNDKSNVVQNTKCCGRSLRLADREIGDVREECRLIRTVSSPRTHVGLLVGSPHAVLAFNLT